MLYIVINIIVSFAKFSTLALSWSLVSKRPLLEETARGARFSKLECVRVQLLLPFQRSDGRWCAPCRVASRPMCPMPQRIAQPIPNL